MSDLISRSALLKKVLVPPCDVVSVDDIKKAPAVDAVNPVRCGECIHRVYKEIEDCTIGGCELFGVATPCDFYCAEGKRRIDDGK